MPARKSRRSRSRSAAAAAPDRDPASRSAHEVAWDAAVRLLAGRDCSELEVRRCLADVDVDVLAAVIGRLRELRYLDDERFARGLCERLARRGYGSERARVELAEHGIEHEQIEAWVEEMATADEERARAQLERRFDGVPETARERARAARFLHNRGYSADLVLAIIGQDW